MSKILIVGGGAAGMMAGVYLARAGHEVHILEKNEKLGKKVYITGKADAMLQITVTRKNCSGQLCLTRNSCTVLSILSRPRT